MCIFFDSFDVNSMDMLIMIPVRILPLIVLLTLSMNCKSQHSDIPGWVKSELFGYDPIERTGQSSNVPFTKFEIPEFETEKICQLAVKANMEYIVFTAHHFSCNFDADHISFNSVDSSTAKRDLVAEMMAACKKYNLAPFFYLNAYYKIVKTENREKNLATIKELLTEYGPIAGIWLDGGGGKDLCIDETNY